MMSVKEYLSLSNQGILSFLEQYLPEIGGEDWWQHTVIGKLSEHQSKLAEQKQFSALRDFDLAALLNVLERNWRAITDSNSGIDYRRGLNLIIELKNIRNHYAHEPTSGTPLDQQLRDVDSITRLLSALNANASLIEMGQALHRELMLLMLGIENGQIATGEQHAEEPGASNEGNGPDTVTTQQKTAEAEKGVPVHWLKAGTILEQAVLNKLRSATYIGIDFGTSTSVVSISVVGDDGQGLHTKAVEIRQVDELGREIHSHLVDTCLAWFNQELLFGVGAAMLKQDLVANQTIWTSFKMGLGVDLGPEYNRTALPEGKYEYTIEKPQQAAAVFLKLLCDGIREYVNEHNLPDQIYYTVTVPASFEANQRQDLFAALEFAGIPEREIRLMDEPNAAFLSYLIDMESRSSKGRFVDALHAKNRNVIVFDFGAGTCDISILEVSVSNDSILSRNLGISKFWALGGDDIDKIIAEQILLPQLCGDKTLAKYLFTSTQLEQQVLPHLKPVAEALKVACCELAEQRGWKTIKDLKNVKNKVMVKPGKALLIEGQQWKIDEPQIRLEQFAEIMALFVGQPCKMKRSTEMVNVLQPIDNALEKVELTKDDIDMVLFIGGSCENPIVRHYVSQHLGRFVESITPRDLRAHVSQGAALYTLFLRGADIDPIRPITSETIYVLTVGDKLAPVVKAGSLVPSEGVLENELVVKREGQKTIDLPFFSGSVHKPIGLVQIKAPAGSSGFKKGERVKIQWSINKEKILSILAEVCEVKQISELQNPLANEEMTEEVLAMLKAKQAFNKAVLEGGGRPTAGATLVYARAAQKAENWRLAAEMLQAVERLDPGTDHSSNICYCYAKDGDNKSSRKWSAIAYERRPCAVTAYNHALDKIHEDSMPDYERLMQECLKFDPNYTAALVTYGNHLIKQGDPLGAEYLQRAFNIFKEEMEDGSLDRSDISRFSQAATSLGKKEMLPSIEKFRNDNQANKKARAFRDENLVDSENPSGRNSGTLGG